MDVKRVSYDRRLLRLAVYAATIGVAFFVSVTGEAYGEILPVASSVLWWPGALLTAALLLTPRRHWLALLLADRPAARGAMAPTTPCFAVAGMGNVVASLHLRPWFMV